MQLWGLPAQWLGAGQPQPPSPIQEHLDASSKITPTKNPHFEDKQLLLICVELLSNVPFYALSIFPSPPHFSASSGSSNLEILRPTHRLWFMVQLDTIYLKTIYKNHFLELFQTMLSRTWKSCTLEPPPLSLRLCQWSLASTTSTPIPLYGGIWIVMQRHQTSCIHE